jgi:hypothetical protein
MEWYETGVTPLRQAQRLKAQLASLGGRWVERRHPDTGYPAPAPPTAVYHLDHIRVDPAMFISRANLGVSDAQVYQQEGVGPLLKGLNERIPGWRRVLEWLEEADDGYPKLWILEGAAPNLVRTLPRLTADPSDPEDVADGQEDHAPDALRYGLGPPSAVPWTRRGLEIFSSWEEPRYEPPPGAEGPEGPEDRAAPPTGGARPETAGTTMARTLTVRKRGPDGVLRPVTRRIPAPSSPRGEMGWEDPAGERPDGGRRRAWGDQTAGGFG